MVQELNSGLLDSIPSPTVGLRAPGLTTAQLSPTGNKLDNVLTGRIQTIARSKISN